MAYQPKSYRKFLATSLSAAMVASAVAPMAASAAEAPNFTDIDGHWAENDINELAAAGIIAGVGDDKFAPDENIKREAAAGLLLKAVGIDYSEVTDPGFSDVTDTEAWYYKAVAAAKENGILNGVSEDEFGVGQTFDRQQAAAALVNAFNLREVAGTDGADLSTDFTDIEDSYAANDIKLLASLDITDGTTDTTFSPAADVTRAQFAGFVAKTLRYLDSLEVAVSDVSTTNLKEVVVEFTSDLTDVEGANDPDNYDLKDANGNSIDISEVVIDGSTATLRLESAVENQDEATLKVSSTLVEDSEELTVQFFDNAVPTVESVEVVGKNTFRVEFSEPIDPSTANAKDAFEVTDADDTNYNIRGAEFDNNNRVAYVEIYSDLEDGEYTLKVNSVYDDYADFTVKEKEVTVEVVVDEEAPELVDVTSVNQNLVVFTFNETIELTEGDGQLVDSGDFLENFFHTNSKNTASKVEVKNGNEIHVTFGADEVLPNGVVNLYIDGESITDLWDNVLENQVSAEIETNYDAEAPSLSKVSQVEDSQDQIEVVFSGLVDEETATDDDNYTVLDEDGEEVAIAEITYDAEEQDRVTITLGKDSYGSFTLEAMAVEDPFGNEMGEESIAFEMSDATAPVTSDFTGYFYQDREADGSPDLEGQTVVIFDFDDKMATSGEYAVNDLSKYTIKNTAGNHIALDTLDSVSLDVADDGSKIEITFDNDELLIADNATFTGTRVADAADNRIDSLTFTYDLNDNTVGTVDFAEITILDENTVQVELDSNLEVYDEQDFNFYIGSTSGDTVTVESSSKVSDNTIEFDLDVELNSDGQVQNANGSLAGYLYLDTDETGDTVNRFDQHVDIAVSLQPDAAANPVVISEELAPVVESVVVTSADTITVTFSEAIESALVDRTTFEVDNYTVTGVTTDGAYDDTIELTIEEVLSSEATPSLSIVDASDILDEFENVYDASDIPDTTTDLD